MTLADAGTLVREAASRGTAIAAFNVVTIEQAEGVVTGAQRAGSPVIIAISQNAVRYHGGQLEPLASAVRACAAQAGVPAGLHLDHVEDDELLRRAPASGFSSVMFDAGRLPYDENEAATRAAATWARDNGIWIEAELGYVGGKAGAAQSAHAPGVRTDPVEAAAFVAATGVDALAVAVGTSHAMTQRTAELDTDLIARIAARVPVPLVLHGSSGVPDEGLRAAARAGMTKINIGTALGIAFTSAVREHLAADMHGVDPRGYLAAGRDAVADEVARLMGVVASAT